MSLPLSNCRVAILATDGFEQAELARPLQVMIEAGASVDLLAPEAGKIQGYHHLDPADTFTVDKALSEASAGDYDALVLPGGLANPDTLRMNAEAVAFVRAFMDGRPVAAICHGPWLLVEAGMSGGRTLTSWPSLQTDIRNAGGRWVDQQVCIDGPLITSRNPGDLDAFCHAIVETLSQRHPQSAAG